MSQAFTEDIDAILKWNDRELITPSDLNGAQAVAQQRISNLMLGRYEVHLPITADDRYRFLNDALMLETTGSTMVVTVRGGTLMRRATTGLTVLQPDAQIAEYTAEDSFTVDANALGSDRWDIVTIKLAWLDQSGEPEWRHSRSKTSSSAITSQQFDKRGRSRLTINYITGSAGAEPSVPSGEEKIARIIVPNGATTLDYEDVWDFRKPMGGSYVDNWLSVFASSTWVYSGASGGVNASGAAQAITFPLIGQGRSQMQRRLHSVVLDAYITTGATVKLQAYDTRNTLTTPSPPTETDILDITSLLGTLDVNDNHLIKFHTTPIWYGGGTHPFHNPSGNSLPVPPVLFGYTVLRIIAGGANERVTGLRHEWWGD